MKPSLCSDDGGDGYDGGGGGDSNDVDGDKGQTLVSRDDSGFWQQPKKIGKYRYSLIGTVRESRTIPRSQISYILVYANIAAAFE